ncbi:MAG: VOC family protein [Gammaproteobacteria bacterium]|nr:VOC family protein [Gammaproteobacteria bacterium]
MAILRIEEVVYGVEDLASCERFFSDAGLELVSSTDASVVLRTPVNQFVRLCRSDDPGLPPAAAPGPNIREVIWGVDSDAGLAGIGRELARDRTVREDALGGLHSRDVSGFGIGFRIAQPVVVNATPRHTNLLGGVGRLNAGVVPYQRPRPLRLIHVALDIQNEGHERANDFYTERLGFRAIDRPLPMGTFMQCEGDIEHHNFLLCHRPDRVAVNHIALEVRDFDEVVEGGNYMTDRGWKESRRLGRHNLGSNVFRMFHAPCGGRIEFAADMDRMDKSFKPRVYEQTPPHHLWMLKFPGDPERS